MGRGAQSQGYGCGFAGRRALASALLIALLATGLSKGAQAGAFNQPEGRGLAIMDVTFSGGSRYFNGQGKLGPSADFKRGDASAYVEYGVTDWLMAVIRPDLTAVRLDGHPSSTYAGLGPSEAGAQVRLLTFGPAVVAAAASFRLPGSTDRHNRALLGDTARSADLRGLFGYSFAIGGWPAFIDIQAAYRVRDQGAPDEIHTDATFGVRPMSDLLLLLQAFDTTDLGKGSVWFPKERFTHVQVGAVYDFAEDWSAELAGYTTVFGRRSLRENGLTTAVWYRF
jgi:hypothetical protein